MKGTHKVRIQNKRVRYEFEVRRNLTVLRGDSATGKTTLIELIQEYINNGESSSILLYCDKPCHILEGSTWKGQLSVIHDSIIFIDEGNRFVFTDDFSNEIQKTDNYFVIVSREALPNLPYSVTEIYGIRTSGKYLGLKQHYHEFYRIYGDGDTGADIYPATVVTEDSRAGFQFFSDICSKNQINCVTSYGKTSILETAKKQSTEGTILLIADGAAFGSEMDRVVKYLRIHKNIRLYVPESFEWLILSAGFAQLSDVKTVLDDPSSYIESRDYFSWERFFTRLLTDRTHGTWLEYSKGQINPSYLRGTIRDAILEEMQKIHLMKK